MKPWFAFSEAILIMLLLCSPSQNAHRQLANRLLDGHGKSSMGCSLLNIVFGLHQRIIWIFDDKRGQALFPYMILL